jgi:hypothetical protein
MRDLMHDLITKCELSIRLTGVSAKGPIAVLALLVLVIFWYLTK